MDTRRLQLLLALSRLGSMRAVADAHHLTTSTVSQQIAALAKEAGAQLIEPDGRRVRLTPAGQRAGRPRGHHPRRHRQRSAGSRSRRRAVRHGARRRLRHRHPGLAAADRRRSRRSSIPDVDLVISEYEPIEAFALLDRRRPRSGADLRLQPGARLARPGRSRPCRCGRSRGDSAFPPTLPMDPPISPPMRIRRGLSTPATPLTKTPFGHWRRSPDSRHGSRTRSTAWTSSRI